VLKLELKIQSAAPEKWLRTLMLGHGKDLFNKGWDVLEGGGYVGRIEVDRHTDATVFPVRLFTRDSEVVIRHDTTVCNIGAVELLKRLEPFAEIRNRAVRHDLAVREAIEFNVVG
jgi:hypothetical protein